MDEQNDELCDLYTSLWALSLVKCRTLRWAEYVARRVMGNGDLYDYDRSRGGIRIVKNRL